MSDRKFKVCEFETAHGHQISVDPLDIVAIGRMPVEETDSVTEDDEYVEVLETQVYTTDGAYWRIKESYIEAQQVWIDARTNNLMLENGDY